MSNIPKLVEPEELAKHLNDDGILIIDLSLPGSYKKGHVPGAVHLSYPAILYAHDDTDCDIPPDELLSETLSKLGLTPETHVIAYDNQCCPMACRFLWTLEEIGHQHYSLLNGGWTSWEATNLPIEQTLNEPTPSHYTAKKIGNALALKDYILSKLNDRNTVLLDTRMEEELTNELIMTDRGGYIPGCVHFDWVDAVDDDNCMRICDFDMLQEKLESKGVTKDKEVIIYCQTHMRSAHTYITLKLLGYPKVLGYAAGFSEWGNDPDTPIENEYFNEENSAPVIESEPEKTEPESQALPNLQLVYNADEKGVDYKVANIELAEFGRQIITTFQDSMPGLMAIKNTYLGKKPFQGIRITGSYRIDPMLAVFIETLHDLGAMVRWAAQDTISTQDNIAAALALRGIPIFAWYQQTESEFQWCIEQALDFPGEMMPHIIIDEGDEGRLLTRHHDNKSDANYHKSSETLEQTKALLDNTARELLMAVIQLAKWERKALGNIAIQKNEHDGDMKLWVADPMICHCNSVVMLKNTLYVCG